MEWIGLIIFFAFVTGVFLTYKADPAGFKNTLERGKKIVRANIGAKKPVKAIERKKDEAERKQWEASFTGQALEAPPTEDKHVIVKTDYQQAMGELWPRWWCKCGANDCEPVIYTGMKDAQNRALRKGRDHVVSMNEAEKNLNSSNGNFAF